VIHLNCRILLSFIFGSNNIHETFPLIICEGLLAVYISVQIFPKKSRNIFSFKKSHLPALKVFLVIALGIVEKESMEWICG